jgi:hypothetical protein
MSEYMKPTDVIENPCGPIVRADSDPRAAAAAAGHVRYVPTTPCKRGHLGERYVSTGACIECLQRFSRKVGGKKLEKGHSPQLISILVAVPLEWGRIWGKQHQDAMTAAVQAYIPMVLEHWAGGKKP